MKRIGVIMGLLVSLGLLVYSSCKKSGDNGTPANPCSSVVCQNGGTCSNGKCSCPTGYTGDHCETALPGSAMIYATHDCGDSVITVTINSQTRTFSGYADTPTCGDTHSANFDLQPGTYTYTASSPAPGCAWHGSVTVAAGTCSKVGLPPTQGRVTFWSSMPSKGYIIVTCEGHTDTVRKAYTTGSPDCGSTGCVTFSFAPGLHEYFTTDSLGATFATSVEAVLGACRKEQVY